MVRSITMQFVADGSVSKSDIRDALAGLTEDDLSKKSPVTAGGGGLVPVMAGEHGGDQHIEVVAGGHSGDWSKTSQDAIEDAVLDVDGVAECIGIDGGYES